MNYEYCAGVTYTIKNGDTLYEISRRHGVPLALLLRANPYVDVFSLQAGDTICIPQKTREELPYPMESPMQNSMEDIDDSVGEGMEDSMENADSSAGIQGGMSGNNNSAWVQGEMSGNNNSAGMQAGMSESSSAGMQTGMSGSNSAGMQAGMSGSNSAGMQAGMSGNNCPAGMQTGMSGKNSSAGIQTGSPEQNSPAGMQKSAGMNRAANQRVDNEQMDEMLVWSEQANLNRGKRSGSQSPEKQWCKYVIKPGDTLQDVFEDMDGDTDEFWERNPASRIYLLPGVAYFVCKKNNN